MRVVAKLGLAFFVASCLCLALYSYVESVRSATRLYSAVESDLRSAGIELRDAVTLIWEEDGPENAERVIRASAGTRDVDISLVRGESALTSAETTTSDTPDGDEREITVSVPVHARDESAKLVLRRRVPGERALVAQTFRSQALFAVTLAVVGGVLAFTLGSSFIGKPLDRIVAQARRIGAGDLSQRLKSTGTDEIGELKREMNMMCDRLVAAQTRIEEESTARVETLEQLRHLDRLRTVGTIASSIAHELGTPLNVLLLRGQSLSTGDIAPDEIAESGRAVLSQVEKMSRIVRQLLDFSRRRDPTKHDAAVDLVEVAEHACGLLHSLAKRHHVEIELDVAKDRALEINGDFGHLEQALTNLIVNGVQAMPSGGTLHVAVRQTDAGASIEVRDEGTGISEADLPRIFEPFFTTKPGGMGTGLGLPVAKGIVEEHGGVIEVKTESGRGTSFVMSFARRS